MIMGKFWAAFRAQVNKLANFFWTADPIAQMQYEYDQAVAQLTEGRKGLEQYRALVERVTLQVQNAKRHAIDLESKVKAYLQAGDRETARQIVLYSAGLVAVTLLPFALGSAGLLYLASALALGAVFVWLAERLRRDLTPRRAAFLFHYSLLYLALLFTALAIDTVVL